MHVYTYTMLEVGQAGISIIELCILRLFPHRTFLLKW